MAKNRFGVPSSTDLPGLCGSGYSYYDFQYMMLVAELGQVAVVDNVMNTYCIHATNTLTSPNFIREYAHRISLSEMKWEWLSSVPDIPAETREAARQAGLREDCKTFWGLTLAALTLEDPSFGRKLLDRYRANPYASRIKKWIGASLVNPLFIKLFGPTLARLRTWKRKSRGFSSHSGGLSREEARNLIDTIDILYEREEKPS